MAILYFAFVESYACPTDNVLSVGSAPQKIRYVGYGWQKSQKKLI